MATIETAPAPDIYGHTTFCDDIRFEIDGKVTYVGVYTAFLFARGEFPLTIPKFCFGITFHQKTEIFRRDIGVHIFLPGDAEDKASIEAGVRHAPDTDIHSAEAIAGEERGEYTMLGANIMFAPFVIPQAGLLKVRILRDGALHPIGSLKVRQHAA